ncbi:MAG TPA: hypothetical protein VFE32_22015 [Puia sp.]|nr:hypothetical protein [Puia sp.]
MFERGYFSHYTPEGKEPFDRMRAGHRANILNLAFHRVGIGIVEGGVHGLMISQEFRN